MFRGWQNHVFRIIRGCKGIFGAQTRSVHRGYETPGRRGIQTGEMVLITDNGAKRMHSLSRGFQAL